SSRLVAAASPEHGQTMRLARSPSNLLPALEELRTGLGAYLLCGFRSQCGGGRCRTFRPDLMRLRPIRLQDHAMEGNRVAVHCCKPGNRRAAGTIKSSQKCPFTGQRNSGFTMCKWREQCVDTSITDTGFNADSALSRRRRKAFRIGQIGNDIAKPQTPQARTGKKRPVNFSGFQLAQAGIDIAAENHHLYVRSK